VSVLCIIEEKLIKTLDMKMERMAALSQGSSWIANNKLSSNFQRLKICKLSNHIVAQAKEIHIFKRRLEKLCPPKRTVGEAQKTKFDKLLGAFSSAEKLKSAIEEYWYENIQKCLLEDEDNNKNTKNVKIGALVEHFSSQISNLTLALNGKQRQIRYSGETLQVAIAIYLKNKAVYKELAAILKFENSFSS
jgi:hypothetical protein